MGPVPERRPPSRDAGGWRRRGQGPHDDVEVRVAYALVNAECLARFLDGVTLQEFRVTAMAEDYRVMLKGVRGGKPVVCFLYEATWRDALRLGVTMLDTGRVYWEPDDYPLKNARQPYVSPPIAR